MQRHPASDMSDSIVHLQHAVDASFQTGRHRRSLTQMTDVKCDSLS